VPLAIVSQIYAKHPELAKAIAAQPHRKTQNEPWISDDPRRLIELTETPWLRASKGGSDDSRLRDLLDPALVTRLRTDALAQLKRAQRPDGGFPWFPGGQANVYMTLYALESLAMLQDFDVQPPKDMIERALAFVARELPRHMEKKEASVAFLAYGAYVLTAFDLKRFRGEVDKWVAYVLENRTLLTPFGRAWMARVLHRLGDGAKSTELLESALDGSRRDPIGGVYWTPERYSWMWYSDSVEKHAFFLRTLAALKPQDPRIDGMAQWLLFNRKGNAWHSTKASAAAVYSLLDYMEKKGALAKSEQFRVRWAELDAHVEVRPDDPRKEPLLWRVEGDKVTPQHGKVTFEKKGPGVAFASATWIFSSNKVQPARASDIAAVERRYFRRVHRGDGDHLEPLASGAQVKVGEEIEVRLTVKTKSQLEYVHIKEPRGAGFEETTLRSGYRWQKVPFYEEPRDSLSNFFVDWLPHGELELRHTMKPTTPGHYKIGSAVVQSMYSPDVTAYSAGMELDVVR
jgi:alpha-2-macroglobulin